MLYNHIPLLKNWRFVIHAFLTVLWWFHVMFLVVFNVFSFMNVSWCSWCHNVLPYLSCHANFLVYLYWIPFIQFNESLSAFVGSASMSRDNRILLACVCSSEMKWICFLVKRPSAQNSFFFRPHPIRYVWYKSCVPTILSSHDVTLPTLLGF